MTYDRQGKPGPLGLFVPPLEENREIPAGLFAHAMRMWQDGKSMDFKLIHILLDAGVVPGEEFPEIFSVVATGGRPPMPGRHFNPLQVADDGELISIARKLLSHRPETLHLENLSSSVEWHPAVRRLFLDEVVFPEIATSDGGVTLCHFGDRSGELSRLVDPGEPIKDTASLFHENLEKLKYTDATLVRRNPDGTWLRESVDWLGDGPLPELRPGDIVEMQPSSEPGATERMRWALVRRLPAFQITVSLDGTEREITVRPDLFAFDPASSEVPMLHAAALARLLGQGLTPEGFGDSFESGSFTLRREGWADLRLAASAAMNVPLQPGDRLILEREPRSVSRESIVLTVPGLPFVRQFFGHAAPTLVQAIADAWSPWHGEELGDFRSRHDEAALAHRASALDHDNAEMWMSTMPHDPDFSRIRIRIRIADDGSEVVMPVDLETVIHALTDESTPEEARMSDVELQRGDIIEIPLRETTDDPPWRGFSPETLRFFDKLLSSRFIVIDPERGPQPHEVRYRSPQFIDSPHGLMAMLSEDGSSSARSTMIGKGNLLRGGVTFSDIHLTHWFVREGDQMTLQSPRVRVVAPTPPGR